MERMRKIKTIKLLFLILVLGITLGLSSCDFILSGIGDDSNKVVVGFDSNGGTEVQSQKVSKGQFATEPSKPTKVDYIFEGWLLNEEPFDFKTPITESIELVAKWKENTEFKLTINYYIDNAPYTSIEYLKLSTFEFADHPEKEGYRFGGWQDSNGAEMSVLDIQKIEMSENRTIVLHGMFLLNAEKVTFNDNLKENGPCTQEGVASKGNPRVLVVPINLRPSMATEKIRGDIETAFNGKSEETGWESVRSFYQKSSYEQLNVEFDVLTSWYTPQKDAETYTDYYNIFTKENGKELLLREVISFYNDVINYNDYDNDGDGYIDAVWLVYNRKVDYGSDSIWWATTNWYDSSTRYDGVRMYCYAFAGTDFLYQDPNLKIDAHTYIHETGHVMGLEDYYDYDSSVGADGGLWGADMMDDTIGDHCPLSKLLFGWISPVVVTGNTTIDLHSFSETGEALLVSKERPDSIYEEYFLIEFYTTTNLNQYDKPFFSDGYGIRVTHVDATQNIVSGEATFHGKSYVSAFKYNNSETKYLMNYMMRADYNTGSNLEVRATTDALFRPGGSVFGETIFQNYKLHDGSPLFFTMVVNEMTAEHANVTIRFK